MTTYYDPASHSAEEWRAMAHSERNTAMVSFERSETDGYLSQASAQAMARLFTRLAEIAEADGKANLPWLFRADGSMIDRWHWVEGKYGPTVRVDSDKAWFAPSNASTGARRLAADRRKGYTFGRVMATRVTVRMGANWTPVVETTEASELFTIAAIDGNRYQD